MSLWLPRADDGATAPPVVDQGVAGLLQHALLVAHDDLRRVQLQQPLEAVIAVDHAAVQVVEVAGGEAAAVELHHGAQVGRNHRQHRQDHPLRLGAVLAEGLDHAQALGGLLAAHAGRVVAVDLLAHARCASLSRSRFWIMVRSDSAPMPALKTVAEVLQQFAHAALRRQLAQLDRLQVLAALECSSRGAPRRPSRSRRVARRSGAAGQGRPRRASISWLVFSLSIARLTWSSMASTRRDASSRSRLMCRVVTASPACTIG